MAKYKLKTTLNESDATSFLQNVEDEQRRKDSLKLLEIMSAITGEPPKMWGTSIVGFGSYHYKYESGHEGDMCLVGFSPRKQNLTLYIITGSEDGTEILSRLGKHKTGKGCLYINKLTDVREEVLRELILASWKYLQKKHK